MLIQQKESGFTLAFSVVFMLLRMLLGGSGKAFGVEITLLLLVLFIVVLWLVRHLSGATLKTLDERDLTIRSQAAIIAVHGFGAVVMAFSLVLYIIHRDTGVVPLSRLIDLAFYGWMSLYTFWSASILILYKTGAWHVG